MKKIFSLLIVTGLTLSTLMLSACGNDSTSTEDESGKMVVAVSIVPETTFAKAVCGDLAEVITMIPPGSSPENYEPTPQQMVQFSESSIYFSIGVPTEGTAILPNVGDVKVVHLEKAVSQAYPDRTFESGERDPHIWLSPKRAVVMVQAIADEMSVIDAPNKDTYEKNAKEYIAKLEKLDEDISSAWDGVQNRKYIVYHPAFGYLADDYGLEMFALEEEGKEATPQHLQEMIDLAKAENIKVIFYQEEIDSSQSKAYAEEIGGKTTQLSPLSADYIENLQKMADTIREAIQ